MSKGYYAATAAAMRQALMARAATEAYEKAIWQKSQTDAARLKLADQAHQRGDIKTAVYIYIRLTHSHPPNQVTEDAKERIKSLPKEAYDKLATIDATLSGYDMQFSLYELYDDRIDHQSNQGIAAWEKTVHQAFEKYDQLADDYQVLPSVSKKLKSQVKVQHRRPEIAAVLNEPEAKTLYEAGQQHETDGHACCAYWVYRQAADLRRSLRPKGPNPAGDHGGRPRDHGRRRGLPGNAALPPALCPRRTPNKRQSRPRPRTVRRNRRACPN